MRTSPWKVFDGRRPSSGDRTMAAVRDDQSVSVRSSRRGACSTVPDFSAATASTKARGTGSLRTRTASVLNPWIVDVVDPGQAPRQSTRLWGRANLLSYEEVFGAVDDPRVEWIRTFPADDAPRGHHRTRPRLTPRARRRPAPQADAGPTGRTLATPSGSKNFASVARSDRVRPTSAGRCRGSPRRSGLLVALCR